MTERKFFSGNNLQQAVMKASREFDIPPDDLAYEQVEKKHGFLKIRRNVVIEVDPENPRRALSDEEALRRAQQIEPEVGVPRRGATLTETSERKGPPKGKKRRRDSKGAEPRRKSADRDRPPRERSKKRRAPSRERSARPERPAREKAPSRRDTDGMVELPDAPERPKEKYPPAEGEIAEAIEEGLEMLLDVAGVEMESSVLQGEDRYEIELWGPDQDRLLADDGRPLLGIQHLLVRVVRGLTGESIYCRVDCDQFHDIREERLRDLAQRVASEVQRRNRPKLLESMAPDERRIVHIALTDDPNVTTESVGRGYFKRVKIRPS